MLVQPSARSMLSSSRRITGLAPQCSSCRTHAFGHQQLWPSPVRAGTVRGWHRGTACGFLQCRLLGSGAWVGLPAAGSWALLLAPQSACRRWGCGRRLVAGDLGGRLWAHGGLQGAHCRWCRPRQPQPHAHPGMARWRGSSWQAGVMVSIRNARLITRASSRASPAAGSEACAGRPCRKPLVWYTARARVAHAHFQPQAIAVSPRHAATGPARPK